MYRPLVAASLSLFVVACSGVKTAPDRVVNVPENLRGDASESLVLIVPAKGVQIYQCREKADERGGYGWVFVAPEADLFDRQGRKIGRHYAGPHWESSDGSRIAGKVKESASAPRADSIPWLLLGTKSVGPQGAFSGVTSIQRVNTVAGVAPMSGCTQHTAGAVTRVPYLADYYFLAYR